MKNILFLVSFTFEKDSIIIFSGNSRNVINPKLVKHLNNKSELIDKMYENRTPIEQGIPIADKKSCPRLGEILYENEEGVTYAMCITSVIDKPENTSLRAKFNKLIKESKLLEEENFKFDATPRT